MTQKMTTTCNGCGKVVTPMEKATTIVVSRIPGSEEGDLHYCRDGCFVRAMAELLGQLAAKGVAR